MTTHAFNRRSVLPLPCLKRCGKRPPFVVVSTDMHSLLSWIYYVRFEGVTSEHKWKEMMPLVQRLDSREAKQFPNIANQPPQRETHNLHGSKSKAQLGRTWDWIYISKHQPGQYHQQQYIDMLLHEAAAILRWYYLDGIIFHRRALKMKCSPWLDGEQRTRLGSESHTGIPSL